MTAIANTTKRVAPTFGGDRKALVLLSAVAGYVDTAGYLALFGLFTAHVTGNFVTAGAALARRAPEGVIARLAMLPIFMLSVAATTLIARALRHRGKEPLVTLLALMTALLGTFCAMGILLESKANGPDAWPVIAIGGTGVIALGIQNALMREALGSMSPTTVMTGNLTQLTIDVVQLVFPLTMDPERRAQARAETVQRVAKFGLPLVGFVAGAALGAWVTGAIGLSSLALPTLAGGALTAMAMRRARNVDG